MYSNGSRKWYGLENVVCGCEVVTLNGKDSGRIQEDLRSVESGK